MSTSPRYPFSDLTPQQLEALITTARVERAKAIRSFVAKLFRVRRQREAQAWPANHEPALSVRAYR